MSEPISSAPGDVGGELSASELAALKVFRDFRIAPGEMFCFTGPALEKHQKSLNQLVIKDLLVKEQFTSGYSMTAGGFRAMVAARRS
jgi:hypothetical protein